MYINEDILHFLLQEKAVKIENPLYVCPFSSQFMSFTQLPSETVWVPPMEENTLPARPRPVPVPKTGQGSSQPVVSSVNASIVAPPVVTPVAEPICLSMLLSLTCLSSRWLMHPSFCHLLMHPSSFHRSSCQLLNLSFNLSMHPSLFRPSLCRFLKLFKLIHLSMHPASFQPSSCQFLKLFKLTCLSMYPPLFHPSLSWSLTWNLSFCHRFLKLFKLTHLSMHPPSSHLSSSRLLNLSPLFLG